MQNPAANSKPARANTARLGAAEKLAGNDQKNEITRSKSYHSKNVKVQDSILGNKDGSDTN